MFKPILNTFVALYKSLLSGLQPPPDFPKYKTHIFGSVGLLTLGLALALVLVYYYAFNTPNAFLGRAWNRARHWWLTLLLTAGLGTWLAYGFSSSIVVNEAIGVKHTAYFGYFLVANAVVATLWFLLFSVLLKFKSEQAKTTPFAWPRFAR